MATSLLRYGTAAIVLIAGGLLAGAGSLLALYQWRESQALAVLATQPAGYYWRDFHPEFWNRIESARATIDAYRGLPLVGLAARRLYVRMVDPQDEPEAFQSALEAVLARQPASGEYWFALAHARIANGAPMPKVMDAIEMSRLMAPREADTMVPRAALVVRLWEQAPDRLREMALADITAFGQLVDTALFGPFKAAMLTKSQALRQEIGARLQDRLPADQRFWGYVFGFDWTAR